MLGKGDVVLICEVGKFKSKYKIAVVDEGGMRAVYMRKEEDSDKYLPREEKGRDKRSQGFEWGVPFLGPVRGKSALLGGA